MRKLIALCLLLATTPAFATFGAASAWDVRTTGVDTNGGAFDSGVGSPGTDESQGSGTAITVTLTGTTTGTGSPVFSATTHGPGNFVHIASGSGCSTGWFEVLSQAAGVATFDRAMGVATNVCVGTIGGSLLTIQQANTNSVLSNTIWIKAGTYTFTTTMAVSVATVTFNGYNSTPGDNGTKPLITTATNSTNLLSTGFGGPGTVLFNNLSLSNTASVRASGIVALSTHAATEYWVFNNCTLDGFTTGINSDNVGSDFTIANIIVNATEIKNSTSSGITTDNSTGSLSELYVLGSYFHGNVTAISQSSTTSGFTVLDHDIFASNTGAGTVSLRTPGFNVLNCTFAGNTGEALQMNNAAYSPTIVANSIFYGNSRGINNGNTFTPGIIYGSRNNAFGNNTNVNANWSGALSDIAITAGPFTNSGSGDYSLNSTAGGGALLKGAGYPGIFPGATSTGSLDVGAVQSAGGGGGAAGNFGVSN